MLSCNIWFSAPFFWMGLENRRVGRVYGADGAVPSRRAYSAKFQVNVSERSDDDTRGVPKIETSFAK